MSEKDVKYNGIELKVIGNFIEPVDSSIIHEFGSEPFTEDCYIDDMEVYHCNEEITAMLSDAQLNDITQECFK